MTRGIKPDVDRFINDLMGKYLPFNYKGAPSLVQIAVRPLQLWEIVFPREHKDIVLNTVLCGDGKTQHKKHKKWITVLRKILGIQKIPEFKTDAVLPVYRANTEFIGVGIKEDYNFEDGTEAL